MIVLIKLLKGSSFNLIVIFGVPSFTMTSSIVISSLSFPASSIVLNISVYASGVVKVSVFPLISSHVMPWSLLTMIVCPIPLSFGVVLPVIVNGDANALSSLKSSILSIVGTSGFSLSIRTLMVDGVPSPVLMTPLNSYVSFCHASSSIFSVSSSSVVHVVSPAFRYSYVIVSVILVLVLLNVMITSSFTHFPLVYGVSLPSFNSAFMDTIGYDATTSLTSTSALAFSPAPLTISNR